MMSETSALDDHGARFQARLESNGAPIVGIHRNARREQAH